MQRIRAFSRKMGTPVDTSCVVTLVFPNFLWQQTSHIQQVSPTSGGLNSFVLPLHKWVPLLLQYKVMPQGEILTWPRIHERQFHPMRTNVSRKRIPVMPCRFAANEHFHLSRVFSGLSDPFFKSCVSIQVIAESKYYLRDLNSSPVKRSRVPAS